MKQNEILIIVNKYVSPRKFITILEAEKHTKSQILKHDLFCTIFYYNF